MKDERGCAGSAAYGTNALKVLMTLVLVVWWLIGPTVGYYPVGEPTGTGAGTFWEHLLWPLSHANVWHLAGNAWVLWWLKGKRLFLGEAYVMAVACSFLPVLPGAWEMMPDADATGVVATCGFSGVLCAMIGVKWGAWMKGCAGCAAYWTFAKRVLPFVAIGAVIPHVNWSIHFYCVMAGLVYGRWQ